MKAFLNRLTDDSRETLGHLSIWDGLSQVFECWTLELPWKDNAHQISCIPTGNYFVEPYTSPTKGECYAVMGVPNRMDILVHAGNFIKDTQGCVLVGNSISDINKDGDLEVCGSRATLTQMLLKAPKGFLLCVSSANAVAQNSGMSASFATSPFVQY